MVLNPGTRRALFALAPMLVIVSALCGCEDRGGEPLPPPVDALRDSRVVSLQGLKVQFFDGTVMTLPDATPRAVIHTPGIILTDAEAIGGGVRLNSVTGSGPRQIAAALDERLAAEGWKVTTAADGETLAHRSYRRGDAVADIKVQSAQTHTTLATQIEVAPDQP